MHWRTVAWGLWLVAALRSLGACSEETPADTGSAYLPIAVGNRWVYDEVLASTGANLAIVTKEVIGTETHNGVKTFVRVTTETNSTESKRAHWRVHGKRIMRLDQDRIGADGTLLTSREYDPGFLRFDDGLTEVGATLQEQHLRSEYDATGLLVDQKHKEYTWTVEASDDEVTVPAGTFVCLRVRRVDADVGNEQFWYAEGVGVVKEDDGLEQELLREYIAN
jgi:hypothetical protein